MKPSTAEKDWSAQVLPQISIPPPSLARKQRGSQLGCLKRSKPSSVIYDRLAPRHIALFVVFGATALARELACSPLRKRGQLDSTSSRSASYNSGFLATLFASADPRLLVLTFIVIVVVEEAALRYRENRRCDIITKGHSLIAGKLSDSPTSCGPDSAETEGEIDQSTSLSGTKSTTEFSCERLLEQIFILNENENRMPAAAYLSLCREMTKLFFLLGSGLNFAFSSLEGYMKTLDKKLAELEVSFATDSTSPTLSPVSGPSAPPSPRTPPSARVNGNGTRHTGAEGGLYDEAAAINEKGSRTAWTIQEWVTQESERGDIERSTKSNPAAARCFLRLMWFVDFVERLLFNLAEFSSDEVSKCASKAYQETLAPRHPWIVQKGVTAALGACPTRKDFFAKLAVKDKDGIISEKLAIEKLQQVAAGMKSVETKLWEFFEKHNIKDLK